MPKDTPILVVDDSPAILALLRDLLKAKGYSNVSTAGSVEEGLQVVKERHPQVVFLDLMMPDTSGLEFTKTALAEDPHLRIVVTTALPPTHESVMMAISQGASEYLPKPLRKDTLSTVLDHLEHNGNATENVGYG